MSRYQRVSMVNGRRVTSFVDYSPAEKEEMRSTFGECGRCHHPLHPVVIEDSEATMVHVGCDCSHDPALGGPVLPLGVRCDT